ncbi:hypothetical protein SAMN06265368_1068 [Cohaesibacter gelatinilyticus]|uniref:Uncharacterized protein n=1 Tax=Cohaesibacter gelatinilyticus TaxID=372072 RepID=A0A285NDM0_9HYPH|nr:hypothetical protein SAMN06265368_1068 [Cohaesibacter gelatinilyticus]
MGEHPQYIASIGQDRIVTNGANARIYLKIEGSLEICPNQTLPQTR